MPEWLQSLIGLIGISAYAYINYRVRKYIFGNDNNSNNEREGIEVKEKNKDWNKMTQDERDKRIEEFAKILGIDLNTPLPDLSDPQVISRLARKFTKDCADEIAKDDEMQAKAMAGAREVMIWD